MEFDNIRIISNTNNINYNIKHNYNILDFSDKNILKEKYLERDNISISFLDAVINEANKNSMYSKRELNYYIHEGSKRVIVRVINSDTKEMIKEIPDKKLLDIIWKIQENIGILFDDTI